MATRRMATERVRGLWTFVRDVVREFGRDQCSFLAAGVCYFVVFSFFPLLLGTLSILGYLVSPEWAMDQIRAGLGQAVPPQLTFVRDLLEQVVAARGPTGFVALVLLLWSGKGVFMSLGEALDIIWNAHEVLGWRDNLRRNAVALVLAVGLGGAVIALSLVNWVLVLVMQHEIPGLHLNPGDFPLVLWVLGNVLPVALIGLGLLMVYRFMPIRHLPGRAITLGAASAAVIWEIGRRLFSLYMDHFARFSSVYGPVGGIIAVMLWVYVSAMIFLFGAEVAARYAHAKTAGFAGEANSPSAR